MVQEVGAGEDRVVLWLRKSKTDQRGKGMRAVLFSLPGLRVCPVSGVRAFMGVRPNKGGPFLLHEDGSYLSRFQFVAVARKCLRAAGFDCLQFASHSFHIGVTTEAARCELNEAGVKKIGRWESKRFHSYVRPLLLSEGF